MQMLLLWRRKKAARATVGQLIKHLNKLQQTDLAEDVAEMLEVEMDDLTITVEPERPKFRTRSGLKHSKRGHNSSKRGQMKKREYFSQSSGFSSENPSSPDEPQNKNNAVQGFRTSESNEGYQSSGSHKVISRLRQTKDRPHVKIPKANPPPDVDIRKDQLSKRTSKLRFQQQQHHRSHDQHQNGRGAGTGNGNSAISSSKRLTRSHGRAGSDDSTDSDLIVSEGGSDIAEESDIDEQEEIATSTMLDCGDPTAAGGSEEEEEEVLQSRAHLPG